MYSDGLPLAGLRFVWSIQRSKCVLSPPFMESFATQWFLGAVDVASLCWCFNLKINITKFIDTYLRPMVTHYKNQGQEKWDSCRDTCNESQILQLSGSDSMLFESLLRQFQYFIADPAGVKCCGNL